MGDKVPDNVDLDHLGGVMDQEVKDDVIHVSLASSGGFVKMSVPQRHQQLLILVHVCYLVDPQLRELVDPVKTTLALPPSHQSLEPSFFRDKFVSQTEAGSELFLFSSP